MQKNGSAASAGDLVIGSVAARMGRSPSRFKGVSMIAWLSKKKDDIVVMTIIAGVLALLLIGGCC